MQDRRQQCKNNHCDDQFKYELDLMLQLHVKGQGPFIAYASAKKWQHYANGVYPDDKCSHAFEDGNHVDRHFLFTHFSS